MLTTINNVPLRIDFKVSPYYPATRFEPAEYSEIYINAVYLGGHNVLNLLKDSVIKRIEEKLEKELPDYKFYGAFP